ncbi:MAG: hypothetical protein ACRDWV_03300, partial [Acidimicrobiales bacterium]
PPPSVSPGTTPRPSLSVKTVLGVVDDGFGGFAGDNTPAFVEREYLAGLGLAPRTFRRGQHPGLR